VSFAAYKDQSSDSEEVGGERKAETINYCSNSDMR
jgi:hypothetical protein